MKTWIVTMLGVAALALPTLGQATRPTSDTAPAAELSPAPAGEANGTVGEVVGTNVNVRAGQTLNDYICTQLSAPANVTIVSEKNGWVEIEPVNGCFSVITKKFVQLDPGGKTGTLTGDRVWYYAAGHARTGTKLSDYWGLQKQLAKGTKVNILNTGSDYYVIATPAGGTFWISGQFVKHQGATTVMHPATTRPTVAANTTTAPTVAATTQPAATDAETAVRELEVALKAELAKPLKERDYTGLAAQYNAIDTTHDDWAKAAVASRLKFLADERNRQAVVAEAEMKAADAEQKAIERERIIAERRVAAAVHPVKPDFAAKGVLAESAVFTGTMGRPKYYVVYSLRGREIVAYATPGTADVDLSRYVGKTVGLMGATSFDKTLRSVVVDVTEDPTVLSETGEIPAAPKATVLAAPEEPKAGPAELPAPTETPSIETTVQVKAPAPTTMPGLAAKPATTSAPASPTELPTANDPVSGEPNEYSAHSEDK